MSSVTIDQTVQEINVSVDETTNNITITVAIDTGGVSSSDHGGLSGLGDDDHSQYALADGTRGSFATTTQGTLADSSLQSGDNISELVNDAGYITGTIPTNTSDLINDGSDNTSTYVENDELGAVATSNDYGDLDNLPSIPSGTVTSVAVSGSDGIDIDSGSPITTSGTIALGIDKTTLLTHINVEDGAEVNDVDSVNGETGVVVLNFFSESVNTNFIEFFGDSITVGQGASSGNDYTELFSTLYSLNGTNRGVSARGAWRIIKEHNLNINITPSCGDNLMSLLMAGFNDVRRGGNDAKTFAKIENCVKSSIVNQFLDRYVIANSGNSEVTLSGFGTSYDGSLVGGKSGTNSNLDGVVATNSGDYVEYVFDDNNVVIGTFASDGVADVFGEFVVTIDGVSQGTFDFNEGCDGISDGDDDNEYCPAVLVFDSLGDGEHTIRITTQDSDTVAVDYFGHLKRPNLCNPIILNESTRMNSTGYATAPANATDAIITELNELINTISTTFISTEYPILIGETDDYFDITTGLGGDNIHPNDEGYRQIYQGVYEGFKNVLIIGDTVKSNPKDEPTGSDKVLNMVSLTQAEYDAGTPLSTTLYIITDA